MGTKPVGRAHTEGNEICTKSFATYCAKRRPRPQADSRNSELHPACPSAPQATVGDVFLPNHGSFPLFNPEPQPPPAEQASLVLLSFCKLLLWLCTLRLTTKPSLISDRVLALQEFGETRPRSRPRPPFLALGMLPGNACAEFWAIFLSALRPTGVPCRLATHHPLALCHRPSPGSLQALLPELRNACGFLASGEELRP